MYRCLYISTDIYIGIYPTYPASVHQKYGRMANLARVVKLYSSSDKAHKKEAVAHIQALGLGFVCMQKNYSAWTFYPFSLVPHVQQRMLSRVS